MQQSPTYIEALSELSKQGQPFVSVTMVEATGSTPQDAGAKMLGRRLWAESTEPSAAGKFEHHAIEHAKAMLLDRDRSLEIERWNLAA